MHLINHNELTAARNHVARRRAILRMQWDAYPGWHQRLGNIWARGLLEITYGLSCCQPTSLHDLDDRWEGMGDMTIPGECDPTRCANDHPGLIPVNLMNNELLLETCARHCRDNFGPYPDRVIAYHMPEEEPLQCNEEHAVIRNIGPICDAIDGVQGCCPHATNLGFVARQLATVADGRKCDPDEVDRIFHNFDA